MPRTEVFYFGASAPEAFCIEVLLKNHLRTGAFSGTAKRTRRLGSVFGHRAVYRERHFVPIRNTARKGCRHRDQNDTGALCVWH